MTFPSTARKAQKYNPQIHHRRSIRLKGYDYSQPGLYFITICTQNKTNLFGEIVKNTRILNIAGKMVEKIWLKIPKIFSNTKLHEYVIMPNHFHAIVEIIPQNIQSPVGADSISAPNRNAGNGANMEFYGANIKSNDAIYVRYRQMTFLCPASVHIFVLSLRKELDKGKRVEKLEKKGDKVNMRFEGNPEK